MKRRILASLLSIFLLIGLFPVSVLAAGTDNPSKTITSGTWDLSEETPWTGVVAVTGDAEIANGTINGTIIVNPGVTLTINNVTVTGTDGAGIKIQTGDAAATLVVTGTNAVTGADGYAGVQVGDGAELTITGSGSLTATGTGNGAGIGGSGSDGTINGASPLI